MAVNNLMLEAATSRLHYWKNELTAAEAAGDVDRIHECARFIREYGVLLDQMADALEGRSQQQPEPPAA